MLNRFILQIRTRTYLWKLKKKKITQLFPSIICLIFLSTLVNLFKIIYTVIELVLLQCKVPHSVFRLFSVDSVTH